MDTQFFPMKTVIYIKETQNRAIVGKRRKKYI